MGPGRTSIGSRVPAPVLVLGGVASVQSGAAIARNLFSDAGPGGTVLLRLAISAVLLLVAVRPDVRRRVRGDVVAVVAFGLVLAAMNATFYEAIDRIPLGVAVTVEFVGPLTVALAGSRRALDLVWVVLAATGVVLLTSGAGGDVDVGGVVLALVAGALWGCYILLSQRVGAAYPGATGLAIALGVGSVALLPLGIASGGTALLHPDVFGRGAAVAVLCSALPYSLELAALRRMRTSVFGVLMSLEPAAAALSGLAFLHQHLRAVEWVAIGCVMAASIGVTRETGRDEIPIEPAATPPDLAKR